MSGPNPIHPLLVRMLRKAGVDPGAPPSDEAGWADLLERVSRTFEQADHDRYTLERSIDVVSDEMKELYDSLRASSDSQLCKERDLLCAVIRSVGDGLCAVDAEGRIMFVNPECERLLGALESDLVGRPALEFVGGAVPSLAIHEVLAGHGCRGDDAVVRRLDGECFPAAYVLTPLLDDGRFAGAVNVFRDITHEKQVVAAVAEARDAALRGSRMKSEFLANMSHELRTPLHGIIGMAELLSNTDLDDRQARFLRSVQACSRSLLELVSDVLDFSKIEAGQIDIAHVAFDLRGLIEEVVAAFDARVDPARVELTASVDDDLPRYLEGDPQRIRQVLLNLIGNAVKFTDSGSIRILVAPDGAVVTPPAVRFRVVDTGIGIDETQQEAVFEAFRQADASATRTHGGTGLGLSICRQLTRLMGGRIGVLSQAGKGSEFWFAIPLAGVDDVVGVDEAAFPRVGDRPDGAERRVLVCEDNEVNLELLVEILHEAGLDVDTATDGRQAVERFETAPYSLILMDCQMPVLDGFEATRRIRALEADSRRTPIVALTANAVEGDRQRCLDVGMDDYVTKPFVLGELMRVIELWASSDDTAR